MNKIVQGIPLTFKGYSELEEGQDEILSKGDVVIVEAVIDDETFQVHKADDPSVKDHVFDTELDFDVPETDKKVTVKKGSKKKAPAKKKAKAKAEVAQVDEVAEVSEVTEEAVSLDNLDDSKALQIAKMLTNRIQRTFWDLGGILSYIRNNQSYKKVEVNGEFPYDQKEGFAQYVFDELGIRYRKAMYYIEIYEAFAPLGVDVESVLSLGWAKAKELTKVVDGDSVEDWVEMANNMGREDLKAEIKSRTVNASDEINPSQKSKLTSITFKVFDDQANVVGEALAKARDELDADCTDSEAFTHILTEWLSLKG